MDEEIVPGLIVYGVPVGTDDYVTIMLDRKVDEIEKNVNQVVEILHQDKQALWTVLRSSIQHQFGYWLMLVHPSLIQVAARRVDTIMVRVLETLLGYRINTPDLGWNFVVDVPVEALAGMTFQSWVIKQPVRFGGHSIQWRIWLA